MGKYQITVMVEYTYTVDANSETDAHAEAYKYENYRQFGSMYSVDVTELESDEDEEDE